MKNNNTIFDFIRPYSNDELSKMNILELKELLKLISEYYLQLRSSLGLNFKYTFGLEIEFEYANRNLIGKKLKRNFKNNEWHTTFDNSLDYGAEIPTPILIDEKSDWLDVQKACSIVRSNAIIGKNSAGHIHIGTQVLGSDSNSWMNFFRLWIAYENVLFRFSYGEASNARKNIERYSKPIAQILLNECEYLNEHSNYFFESMYRIANDRNLAINLGNVKYGYYDKFEVKNTIEFRCPNGTLNPVIWQNNVNLFMKLLEYSKNKNFNYELVNERIKLNKDNFCNLEYYNKINLEEALELSDMIFTNNIDKIYFLKQYLKYINISEEKNISPKTLIIKGLSNF